MFKQSSSLFHVQAVSITKVEVLVEAPKSPAFNSSTPVSKPPASSAQIFSPNFTNISAIKKKEEKRDTRDVRRMLATPEGEKLTRRLLLGAVHELRDRQTSLGRTENVMSHSSIKCHFKAFETLFFSPRGYTKNV